MLCGFFCAGFFFVDFCVLKSRCSRDFSVNHCPHRTVWIKFTIKSTDNFLLLRYIITHLHQIHLLHLTSLWPPAHRSVCHGDCLFQLWLSSLMIETERSFSILYYTITHLHQIHLSSVWPSAHRTVCWWLSLSAVIESLGTGECVAIYHPFISYRFPAHCSVHT